MRDEMKWYISRFIVCAAVAIGGLFLVTYQPPKAEAQYSDTHRSNIERWGQSNHFWIDEDTERGNISMSATATIQTGTVDVQGGIIIIKETDDEAGLPTPATGEFLLYGCANEAGEKTLRLLTSSDIIAEVYVKDTSTAVNARDAWAATYPDNYPFIAFDGTTKYLLDLSKRVGPQTDVFLWPSMLSRVVKGTTDTIINPVPAQYWGNATMRVLTY